MIPGIITTKKKVTIILVRKIERATPFLKSLNSIQPKYQVLSISLLEIRQEVTLICYEVYPVEVRGVTTLVSFTLMYIQLKSDELE